MQRSLVKRRLAQYGAAWAGSFVLVLLASLAAVFLLNMPMADAADLLLMIALPVLALAMIGTVVLSFLRPGGAGAKLALLLLAIVLFLPLLWAPVLAVVVTAWAAGAAIEYSNVYAQFRITVSNLLYPLVASVVSGAAIRWVWNMFQIVASIIGAISSAIQVWNFFQKLFNPAPPSEAPAEAFADLSDTPPYEA